MSASASRPTKCTSSRAFSVVRRCSAATPGRRSALAKNPLEVRQWQPTITLSSTLILANSATFWKVRPMPRAAMRWRGICSSAWPSNDTEPLLHSYSRDRQLKSVVLPAPLGPIRPAICPASTPNDTPSRATMPPKRTDTSDTSSSRPLPELPSGCSSAPVISLPCVACPAITAVDGNGNVILGVRRPGG